MTPRPRSLARRILIWVFRVFAGLVGLALIVFGVIHTDWARDKVRGKLEEALHKQIRGTVTVGRVEGDLLDAVTVRDIVVRYPDGTQAIRIASLYIDYRIGPLMDNHFHADSLVVHGLEVDARRAPDGHMMLADLWIQEPRGDPETWTITLEDVQVDGSSITIESQPGAFDHFTGVALRAALAVGLDRTEVQVGAVRARWEEKARDLTATGNVLFGKLDVQVSDAAVTFGGSRVEVPVLRRAAKGETVASAGVAVTAADLRALWPDSKLAGDARLIIHAVQPKPGEPWRASVGGGVGAASLALTGEVRPHGSGADGEVPLGISGSLFWSGARPDALWTGAPRGEVAGQATFEWTGGLDLDGANATVKLAATGTMGGVAVSRSEVTAELADGVAHAVVSADASVGQVAAEARVRLPGQGQGVRDAVVESSSVEAHIPDVGRVERLLGRAPSVRGAVSLRARASGPLRDLAVRARVTSPALRRQDLRVSGVDLQVAVTDAVDAPAGTAAIRVTDIASGGRSFGGARVDARVAARGRSVAARFKLSGNRDLSASGAVRAEIDGGAEDAREVRVAIDTLRVRTRDLEWTGDDGHLVVASGGRAISGGIELRSDAGHVRVAGSLVGAVELDADLDLARLAGGLGAAKASKVQGHATAKGRVVLPSGPGTLDVAVTGVGWKAGPKKLEAKLAARLAARHLTVHLDTTVDDVGTARADLVARSPSRLTDGAAWMRMGTPAAPRGGRAAEIESVEVVSDDVDLAKLAALVGQDHIAAGTAKVQLTAGPALHTGRLSLDLAGVRFTSAPKTDTLRFDAHTDVELAGDRVLIGLRADSGARGAVTASVVLDRPARPFDPDAWRRAGSSILRSAEVRAKGVQLSQFETLFRPVDSDKARMAPRLDLGGTVDVDLDATPHAERITARVTLHAVRARALASPLAGTLGAEVDRDHARLTIDLKLDRAPILRGAVRFGAGTDLLLQRGPDLGARLRAVALEGKVSIPEQPIQPLVHIVDPDAQIAGRLSGAIRVHGSVAALRAGLDLHAPGVTAEGIRFDTFEVDATYAPEGWTAKALAVQADGGRLSLNAHAGTDDRDPLSVRFKARNIKLGFLSPLWRRPGGGLTHLDGLLHADLTIQGSPTRPVVDGWVRVRDGEARVPDFLRPITGLRLDLTFKDSVGTLAVRGNSRPGKMQLDASADLRHPAAATFTARVHGMKLPVLAGTQLLSVNGYVRARGRLENRLWTIDTAIERGLVVRLPAGGAGELHDTAPLDDVVFVDPAGIAARKGAEEAAQQIGMGFKMRIHTEDRVIVRGDMVATDVAADVTMTMVAGATAMTGQVEAVRGYVEILGRRYDIERARVVFAGEMPIDPRLDVRVSHRFPSTNLYIDVLGRASRPIVTFASDSGGYDQAQLLALIMSGDSPGDQAGVSQQSASAAVNLAAGQLTQSIRESGLPIDALRVGTEAGSEKPITYVTVGKWLTPRVFVAFRKRFEAEVNENASEGVFQHYFARDWMWEGVAGDRGTASADLLWVVPF